MRIYHNQLTNTLRQGFKPVWLIFGDEPWQKYDCLSQIKSTAGQQGFDELIRFSADDKFDWQLLLQEYQAMSLFSSQRLIEVELVTAKINDSGVKALQHLSTHLHQDVQLIFHGPKVDAASQKRKWFKCLEPKGVFIPLFDIEGKQLTLWLQNQSQQLGLNLHPDVISILLELFEGNLPALQQELQKLALLFGEQLVSLADAEPLLIRQAKFNPFQLIDALLLGNIAKCITMLDQLRQDGTALGQLIWVIHKEISQLLTMKEQLNQGQALNELFSQYRIWDKRKPLYQHALTHIHLANIAHAQARLAHVDLLSKTSSDFDGYLLLADVCISLYHGEHTAKFSLDYEYDG